MKTLALILGWFVLIALILTMFTGLSLIAIASFQELRDWMKMKRKFKK
jgi:hypothetical protein